MVIAGDTAVVIGGQPSRSEGFDVVDLGVGGAHLTERAEAAPIS